MSDRLMGVRAGLPVLVGDNATRAILADSPAMARHDRIAIRNLARQTERDFLGDGAREYIDCEHCAEEILDGETNTCMGLMCSRVLCRRCAEPGEHECGSAS